jgi:hypothetical protein
MVDVHSAFASAPYNRKTGKTLQAERKLNAWLKTVASAILADVESGFQPGGKISAMKNSPVKGERLDPESNFS